MNRTVIILAFSLIMSACDKEEEMQQCTNTPPRVGYSVYLKGYDVADVDTIVVREYTHDGNFSSLISTKTILSPTATKIGDVVYQDSVFNEAIGSGTRFLGCNNRADYEVEIPAVGRSYRISGINYGADTVETYMSARCPRLSVGYAYPSDPQIVGAYELQGGQFGHSIFLK